MNYLDKLLLNIFPVLISSVIFLLFSACAKDNAPANTLLLTADVKALAVEVTIIDLETMKRQKIALGVVERDLTEGASPLFIKIEPGEGYEGQVMICGWSVDADSHVIASGTIKTKFSFTDNTVQHHLHLSSSRQDDDKDCFSPNDTAFFDCNDSLYNGAAVNPIQKELCDDKIDNNCNGLINENCPCTEGETHECYDSNYQQYMGIGICKPGIQTCHNNNWGKCEGMVLPKSKEVCDNDDDENCNGSRDEQCSCSDNNIRYCWMNHISKQWQDLVYIDKDGGEHRPHGITTPICRAGTQKCTNGQWGECENSRDINVPESGISTVADLVGEPWHESACDGLDNDCDGQIDEGFDADMDGFNICGSIKNYNPVEIDPLNVDCNDSNPQIRPYLNDKCNDDNNCGTAACILQSCNYYVEKDGDCYKSHQYYGICQEDGSCSNKSSCQADLTSSTELFKKRESCHILQHNSCNMTRAPEYIPVNDDDPYGDCPDKINCAVYMGWNGMSCMGIKASNLSTRCVDGKCATAQYICNEQEPQVIASCSSLSCVRQTDSCQAGMTIPELYDISTHCYANRASPGCDDGGRKQCDETGKCITKAGASCTFGSVRIDNCDLDQYCVYTDDNGLQAGCFSIDKIKQDLNECQYWDTSSGEIKNRAELTTCETTKVCEDGKCVRLDEGNCTADSECLAGHHCICTDAYCQIKKCRNITCDRCKYSANSNDACTDNLAPYYDGSNGYGCDDNGEKCDGKGSCKLDDGEDCSNFLGIGCDGGKACISGVHEHSAFGHYECIRVQE